ncbi:hypothetical protein N9L47_08550 [Rhodobacteraceae bacterium]|nr:hypothetical protein [Paracoccaceae bacterium]
MVWTFGDGTAFTSYVAINELGSLAHNYTVNFDGVQNFQLLSATLLSSEFEDGYIGSASDTDASLYEVPVVGDLQFEFTDDGLQFEFERSYDAAEISISENTGSLGSTGRDWISGTLSDEIIAGYEGDDFILGGAGNDTVQGGEGADQIDGGGGDDVIFGGDAADEAAWEAFLQYNRQVTTAQIVEPRSSGIPDSPVSADALIFQVDSFDFDV